MKRHVLEKIYESDYMPSSYLLVMPYASGSGGNPVSGISLNNGEDVNVIGPGLCPIVSPRSTLVELCGFI